MPWTNEEVVTALDSLFVDDQPWLSPDGLTVMFTSNRPDGGDLDIFVSQRADLSIDGWEIPTLVSEASTNQMDESDPWSLPDRSYIMFTRGPEGQGDRDIYEMRLLPSR